MWTSGSTGSSRLYISLILAFTGLVSVVASISLTRDVRTPLAIEIDSILDRPENSTAFWGIYVRSVADSAVVYERNSDKLLIPASNQKLLTTATALNFLGGEYRYETPLLLIGKRDKETIKGDLVIVGSGDPTFGSRDRLPDSVDPFERWADELYAAGIRKIEGRIIGDDDVFDDELFGDGWDVSMLATKAYAAPVGGISYKSNTIRMRVEGYMPGKAPRINAEPDGYFSITNDVATHARRRGRRIDVIRHLGFESLQLQGSVSRRFRGSLEIPVANPTTFAVTSFKQVLQARGIVVDAEVYDIDELQVEFNYLHADTLSTFESEPLASIVMRINKESDNQYAEQIFRTFGWRGSAIGGERRTKQLLDEAKIKHSGVSVRDGSGLSRKNLISARMLGELLAYMQTHPEAETFVNSLAVSGEDESTLERRLTKLDIKAKTGSLEYVRSLSGYVTSADGQLYAFTIIVNNYTSSASSVRRAIDEIVGKIATLPPAD